MYTRMLSRLTDRNRGKGFALRAPSGRVEAAGGATGGD
jgi:hypothetical protein